MPAFRISSSRLRSPLNGTSRPSMFNVFAATVLLMLPSNDFVSVVFMLWSQAVVLYADDGFELASIRTDAALDAEGLVDRVSLFLFAGDRVHRTLPGARGAALALGRVNAWLGQRFALAGGTMLVKHMRVVFLAEVAQRGEH